MFMDLSTAIMSDIPVIDAYFEYYTFPSKS